MLNELLKELGIDNFRIIDNFEGGNSEVYQIRTAGEVDFGIKIYKGYDSCMF
jgi:hypothetical protein